MKKFYSAVSLLLVLTLLLSCVGPVYAAEPTKATGSAYNEMIVGDWLFTDTIVNRGTNGAALIMKDYAAAGVTDVYLLCKGIAGRVAWATKVTGAVRSSSTRDYLKEACDAAKPYGIRVHAWMMASRDTHYVTNIDSNSPCYHFRVGTSNSVNQYINLRDTGYRNYMTALVKELVANYDIAGIHLDTIRYGALYYDWGLNARTELMNNYGMTKAEWNAATKAMCVTGGYSYTTNADGYYVYSSSGTTATGVSLSGALAGNGSTDALNGAKKIAQFRKDNITNFVKVIRSAAGSNKVISCAIMPETCTSSYESMLYGQSPEGLGSVVDYVAVMAYSSEYVQPSSWPTTLVKACTAVGCRAIAGIQTYPSEGSSDPDPNGQIIFDETYGIRKAMLTDSSIRGYALFRGSFTDLAGAKYIDANTVDITVAPGDDAASATKYVFTLQNGMTCNSISNKSGWASGTSFSISSDKKTITISNGGSTILSKNSSASFRMAVSGTVDETLGIAKLRSYRTSSYTEGYGYCGTLMPKHTHEYTANITTAATCAKEGVKTYTCNCGHSYTEPIAKTAHDYTAATGSNGVTTYTCKVCKTSFSTTCGDTHSNIETWVLADKMHRTICYDCKQGVTEKCVFEELTRVDPTATADGYVTYICVGSASISKSVSHDAFSGKGCGRTYNVTLPKGTEYTYTNAGNGTHTRTGVDSDVTETNLSHSYVNGVCACGEPERNFIQLHFNDNSVANKLGYWSVNSVRGSIHTANSSFAGVAYGTDPYISMLHTGDVLHYQIKSGDIVEVRIKAKILSGTTTNAQFFYTTTADKKYSEAKSVITNYSQTPNGEYQILRFNLNKDVGAFINALRLDPFGGNSANFRANFEIDYIYVGSANHAPSAQANSVFMDFTNDSRAAARYLTGDVYGGFNYDQKHWYYNAKRSAKPAIDTKAGTMTLTIAPTTDNYSSTGVSPYIQTADLSMTGSGTPLNYVPKTTDVVQMRVKFENCALIEGGKARIRLYFIKNGDDGSAGVDASDYITIVVDEADLSSGKWVTYTTNVGSTFGSASSINALRPMFNTIRSADGKTGKITIDYIYVGASEAVPEQKSLMFDFNNSADDQLRYSSNVYGNVNFDRPENWYYYQDVNVSKFAIDNANGTMNVEAVGVFDATKYPCIYMDTVQNSSYHTYPLDFDPADAEVYQVRFKMENFTSGVHTNADGKEVSTPPYVTLSYFIDGVNTTHSACEAAKFDVSYLTSGEYLTVTVNLNDEFRAQDRIEKLRVFFGGIESISATKLGKLTVDFIYIGPKATLPVQDSLYMNFGNTQADKDRYSSRTYGEVNFDQPANWYYYQDVNVSKFAIDNANGTMNVDAVGVFDATKYPCIYMDTVQNSSYHTYPLNFDPANAEVYQVRFKMENFTSGVYTNADGKEVSTPPYVTLSYFIDGVNKTHSACEAAKFDVSYLTSGQYLTMTVNLNDAFRGEEHIDKIRFFFGGIESISEATPGKLTIDYFYIGPKAGMPQKEYTVTFVDANGKTLQTQKVAAGQTAKYTGATPTKAYDATNHYTFKGWDKALSNIQGNITVTAQFTATAHTLTYAKVDGTNHKGTCSCGYSKTAAHGWDAGKVTTAATCANTGVKTYTCSTCKATKTETIAKVPHSYTSKVTTAATCTKAGVKTFTCSKCSHSYTEAIAATGHTVVTDKAVAATCTTAGKTEGTHCSVCNTVLVAQKTVAALGHSYRYADNGNGTHTVTCSRCSYKDTQTHSFTNGTCVCGGTTVTVDESIKIYHTLDLASDISITFAVPQSALANYESYYLECVLPEYEGNKLTDTSTVKVEPTVSGSYYYFTLSGITAVRMGDMVEATLHMTRGTAQYTSKTDSYSVATYAYAMLNSSKDAKMLTLCADLLRYGAEAQTYKKYRTDSLVDGAMTTAHKTYLSNTDTLQFTFTDSSLGDLANPKITWVGKALDLGSKVGMKFVFNTANYTGDIAKLSMKVSYVGSNGETKTVTLTGAEVYSAANKYYSFTFYGLLASELRTIVDVAVYEGNTRLSETLRYSAESYASRNTGGALAPLCKALFAYSDSAKAFFAK